MKYSDFEKLSDLKRDKIIIKWPKMKYWNAQLKNKVTSKVLQARLDDFKMYIESLEVVV